MRRLPACLLGVIVAAGACGSDEAAAPGTSSPDAGVGDGQTSDAPADADAAADDGAIYAAPTGAGTACTRAAPCTLEGARDKARSRNASLSADLYVWLRGGRYALAAPLALDARDSGSGGHDVVWAAYMNETPVVSGGVAITGWQLDDAVRNVWRASVPATLVTRQLYVNGVRATRARGPTLPQGWTKTSTGFSAPDASMASWARPTDIEIFGTTQWKSFRCGVASIAGAAITMKQPCWANTQSQAGVTFDAPTWVENARELLDEEGEFYLDASAHVLYYLPRAGEPMATAEAIAPALEKLVVGAGTLDAPIHDLRFRGITFAHATWLGPSTNDGYACLQAGILGVGSPARGAKTPANLAFEAAHAVTFENDLFTHLGGAGISFEIGSQSNTIVGSLFDDISAAAVTIGNVLDVTDHHPTDPRTIVKGNTLRDDYVTRAGVEYFDSAGIWIGYADSTTLDHDELFDLPYTAVSVGWGWGSVDPGGGSYTTPSSARANVFTNNRISHHMRQLSDGGAIYSLGAQAGSVERSNYIHNQGNPYGSIYLDNGTQGFTVTNNVVAFAPYWLYVQVYAPVAKNNVVTGNFSDRDSWFHPQPVDPSNTVANNGATGGAWPAAALAVMDGAGLEAAYRAMHPPNVAVGKPSSASSIYAPAYSADHANDGDASNGWSPAASDTSAWWQIDLGAATNVRAVEVITRWDIDQPVTRRSFAVWGSDDPTFATHDLLGAQGAAVLPHRAIWRASVALGKTYRYLRVVKTAPEYFFIGEVRVLAD